MSKDFWIFGYGSLMWNPGFDYIDRQPAMIRGLHRRLCIYSFHHRGTEQQPGLVLGLDVGGSCRGIAFRVAANLVEETYAYLTEREQMSFVYKEAYRNIQFKDGKVVSALTYVADRTHRQYAGRLAVDDVIRHVRQGVGISGINGDYVRNTVLELENLNISDPNLSYIIKQL